MKDQESDKKFLGSRESKVFLGISSCDLMHARELGELDFIKKGNAFLYKVESLERYKEKKSRRKI